MKNELFLTKFFPQDPKHFRNQFLLRIRCSNFRRILFGMKFFIRAFFWPGPAPRGRVS